MFFEDMLRVGKAENGFVITTIVKKRGEKPASKEVAEESFGLDEKQHVFETEAAVAGFVTKFLKTGKVPDPSEEFDEAFEESLAEE